MNATWKVLRKTDLPPRREPGFADPAWSRDRDQAHILDAAGVLWRQLFPSPAPQIRSAAREDWSGGFPLLNGLVGEAVADGCKFPREISGGDITLVRLFRQASLDRPTQRSGSFAVLHCDRFGLFPENGHHCFRCCVSSERRAFRSPSRRAPSPKRTGLIGNRGAAASLLRRHVSHRPQNHA